jgi:hypothetical protein
VSDVNFEARVARALRAPVPTGAPAKHAIMEGVRRIARESGGRPHRALGLRTARHSLIGLALAAGIGSITTLSALAPAVPSPREAGALTSTVIGDSVVDRLRDTLRLVRLMFDDPGARQVAVIGDFNGWRSDVTHMRRDERTGRWAVTLALHDGEHRYAIVVDNTRRLTSSPVARTGEHEAQGYSILHVSRTAN